jgi:hypothetical protein
MMMRRSEGIPSDGVDLIFGPSIAYYTRINQMLSIERGLTVLLVQSWETLVNPVEMAELLYLKQATVRYATDQVLRLPPVGEG